MSIWRRGRNYAYTYALWGVLNKKRLRNCTWVPLNYKIKKMEPPKTIKEVEDKMPFHFWGRVIIKKTGKEGIVTNIKNWKVEVTHMRDKVFIYEFNSTWDISDKDAFEFDELEFAWYRYMNEEIYIMRLAHSMSAYANEIQNAMKRLK